ncbi:hypothetical protein AGMMS49587_03410 [Spirochaetia bacterium]|nr:hypothetical protein AGMMS49587_03410 [Spirochaetia bacterium]
MEKPGMDRRRALHRPGLLIRRLLRALLLVLGWTLSGPSLSAQDLRILIRTSPETPSLSEPWTVTLLVDHPLPSEVQVQLPPLPPGLSLERMHSGPRLVQKPAGEAEGVAATLGLTERWTVVEFEFSLQNTGRILLAPIAVTAQGLSAFTAPITLTVRGAEQGESRPHLSWQNPPRILGAGEPAELTLFLSGWDPQRPFPESPLFLPKTPPDAILELAAGTGPPPVTAGEGVILRLNVIPLGGDLFTLPRTPVVLGEFTLDVPALRIPVAAAVNAGSAAAPAGIPALLPPAVPVPAAAIPFPAIELRVFPPFRSACEGIRERAAALWNGGRQAEALAELRRNERDHPAGPALIPLRREAERALGFEQVQGGDEKWRPRLLLGAGFLLSLVLLIITGVIRFFRKKHTINTPCAVTPASSRGYNSIKGRTFAPNFPGSRARLGILIILFVIMGICLYGLGDSARRLLPGSAQYALVRETEARRVPEAEGAVNVRFKAGERVLIRSGRLNWAYAESRISNASPGSSTESRAGWVRIGDIIFY